MGKRRAERAGAGRRWWPTALTAAPFCLLTGLVAAGAADGVDRHLLEVFRPGGVWGQAQQTAQRLEGWASPDHLAVALVLTAVGSAVVRRRAWPVLLAGATSVVAAGLCLLVKLALMRPDPNLRITGPGSYPSGHTLVAVVCAGLFWLLVLPRVRSTGLPGWAWALTGLAGAVMAGCLLLEGAHWASDVVGGLLLGLAVLAVAVRVLPATTTRTTARTEGTGRAVSPGDPAAGTSRGRGQEAGPPRRRAPAHR